MAEERLDIVVFGATGFTGGLVVAELVRLTTGPRGRGGAGGQGSWGPVSWGVAGRSLAKIDALLKDLHTKTKADLSHIRKIVASVEEEGTLRVMAAQTRVLLNCCGPYQTLGARVLHACLSARTHCLDITAEPQFIQKVLLDYGEAAKSAGVYVLTAYGFECVPTDLGFVYLQQNFPGTLNSVDTYVETDILRDWLRKRALGISYGTWKSLVEVLSRWRQNTELNKQLYPDQPTQNKRRLLHKHEGKWCVVYPGSDSVVVQATQHFLQKTKTLPKPITFNLFAAIPSLLVALFLVTAIYIIYFASKCSYVKKLLINHPRFMTLGLVRKENLSEKVMKTSNFRFVFHGRGTDMNNAEKKLIAKVSGKSEYETTATAFVLAALTLLQEEELLPDNGGVYTPGAALCNTTFIKRLHANGTSFELCDE